MDGSKTPPNWKRPSDVMRIHKLRLKKRALDFRLADKEAETAKTEKNNVKNTTSKNPFKYVCFIFKIFRRNKNN